MGASADPEQQGRNQEGEEGRARDQRRKQKGRYMGAKETSKTSPKIALGQQSCKLCLHDTKQILWVHSFNYVGVEGKINTTV